MSHGYNYDLLCIGSGPAGQRAAVQAAKLGKSACICHCCSQLPSGNATHAGQQDRMFAAQKAAERGGKGRCFHETIFA